jgi:hypothetical protein
MNFFELIANSGHDPRTERTVLGGVAQFEKLYNRKPDEVEVINIRRRAKVANWHRDMVVSGKADDDDKDAPEEKVENADKPEKLGIDLQLPETKLNNDKFQMPGDGWIQLAPIGVFPHSKGIDQVIDNKAVESMVSNFNLQKSQDPNFGGLLVDWDHSSENGSTEAAGWLVDLANRGTEGLFGKVRWTDKGREDIENGRYRYISPSWRRSDCEQVGDDPKRCRPTVLADAGLTNQNNLPVKPLSK